MDDTAHGDQFLPRARRCALIAVALASLSLIATGWTAFERGLFQDDVQVLFLIFTAPGGLLQALTLPITSATRRLQGAPYALAIASGEPLLFLRLAGEAVTFGIGLMAAALARYALRLGAGAAFVAGALTIAASSDWLTASLVALGYNLAILLHLAGACALVRWSQTGRWAWLAVAVVLGNASLWTIDPAAPLHPFTPFLALLACDDAAMRRRALWGGVLWVASAAPYYALLASFLADSSGYARKAIVDVTWSARLERVAELFRLNFAPWRWAFGRPNWFPPPPSSLTAGTRFGLAGLGLGVTAWMLAYLGRRMAPPAAAVRRRAPALLALLLLFALLANAPYAAVHVSEFRYRTQLLSRVWASLALAVVYASVMARRSRWARALATALVLIFVGLGLLGGLERQDYFVGYARRLRTELASIVAVLPAVDPGARVLLRLPSHEYYVATEASYLSRAWMTLLAADPSLECRTFLLAPGRGGRCEATADALVCHGDDRSRCAWREGRDFEVLPYDRLVVLSYDPLSNRYRLESRLPDDLLPAGDAAQHARRVYDPTARVRDAPPSWLARSLLDLPASPPLTRQ